MKEQISDLQGKKWLNAKEASQYLSVSTSTIYNLASAGTLKRHYLGGRRIRFLRTELDETLLSVNSNKGEEHGN